MFDPRDYGTDPRTRPAPAPRRDYTQDRERRSRDGHRREYDPATTRERIKDRTDRAVADVGIYRSVAYRDEQSNDADRRIELTAPRTFRASELTEEILIDQPERVALGGRGNLRHLLEQVLQERAVENLVCLWQDACELRILRLDIPHGLVDGLADVRSFRQPQDMVESRRRRQVEDALGLIGGGIVHAGATTSPLPPASPTQPAA